MNPSPPKQKDTSVRAAGQQTTKQSRMERTHLSLQDFENSAKRRLPKAIFGFIAGGAETCQSLTNNHASFADLSFVPRVLNDTRLKECSAQLLGHQYDAPFGVSPMGAIGTAAFRGDLSLAKASAKMNIPFILSAASLVPMERIIEVNENAWFQCYIPGEMPRIEKLIKRVKRAGFKRLVVTVDLSVPGNRENNMRNGWSIPLKPSFVLAYQGLTHPRWLINTALTTLIKDGIPHIENMDAERGPPIISKNLERDIGQREALSWDHIARIRDMWDGSLVLKGILSSEDAAQAQALGVDGIIVSNHGGRQLDGSIAPLSVLSDIVQAAPELEIMLDGGVRRGSDVLKAIGLGARTVFLGRPFLYAVAVAGEKGVEHAGRLLKDEILRNMALLGVTTLADIKKTHIR